ncbi:MAG: hypothetical protein WDM84_02755 [Bauldia sp.]
MNQSQGGGSRTIIYIIVAIIVLGIIYWVAKSHMGAAPTPRQRRKPPRPGSRRQLDGSRSGSQHNGARRSGA